ncbi:hypothetical protein, partial [Campylobacter jejuni]|uniref:hypothetical protein n=1 Tax=Campylobacter jejuni TaxID=197 RepID=UPI001BFEA143
FQDRRRHTVFLPVRGAGNCKKKTAYNDEFFPPLPLKKKEKKKNPPPPPLFSYFFLLNFLML